MTKLVWWSEVWLPLPPHLVFIGLWSLWCCLSLITLTGWLCRSSLLGGLWQDQRAQRLGKLWSSAQSAFWGDKLQPCRGGWVSWAQKSCVPEWAASKSEGSAALSPGLVWEESRNGGGICHLDNSDGPTHLFKHFIRKLVKLSDVKFVFQMRGEQSVLFVLQEWSQECGCKSLPQILQILSTHTVVTWSWLPKLTVSKLL